jgi:hypothetical protein
MQFECVGPRPPTTNKTSSCTRLHYAGHGIEGAGGELVLTTTNGRKRVRTGAIMELLTDEAGYLENQSKIDVLLIFDCCYSFLAGRQLHPSNNVEVITAGDEARDPIAFAAGLKNSFTCKLKVGRKARVLSEPHSQFMFVTHLLNPN